MAGVSLTNGLSDDESDDGLDSLKDSGRESRVLSGEPSGVKMAGHSVVVAYVCTNQPCVLQILGVMH